jgi:hypothetical protein
MPAAAPSSAPKRAFILIPFAVLLVLHPLLIHGPSCGQDLAFHLQSWLDAAQQLRHGTLYPHWDITAAWNAGEPRFLFYPPLSWLLGAVLTLIFPITLCPTIFIAIALLASGFTFHKLASEFASPNAALIASTLYLANPYMLFTAFERSALAELLAAAWIPLLLLALLRPCPTGRPAALATIRAIAIPLALLWLTNAPAAVIGSYTLALVATLRVLYSLWIQKTRHPERTLNAVKGESKDPEADSQPLSSKPFQPRSPSPLHLALTYLAGALLGLTLPAVYLLSAAYERKYIQTAMAILPNMRYQDNFLFTPTTDAAHNAVNHTISLLALTLLLITAAAVLTLLLERSLHRKNFAAKKPALLRSQESVILSEVSRSNARVTQPKNPEALQARNKPVILSERSESKDPEEHRAPHTSRTFLPSTLALLTAIIAFLLTPLSTPIWHHLPNLAYLQFPWRLLTLLTPILALSVALLLDTHNNMGAPCLDSETWVLRIPPRATTALTLLLPLALAIPAYRLYHQPPDPTDDPTHLAQLFTTHHGFPPTDEYTPLLADNDPLRSNSPPYWLAHSPNDPAPNTTPTAAELNPTLDTDDTPIPDTQTLSTPAPHHFDIHVPTRSYLILNLRDYPNWDITTTTLDARRQIQLSPSAQDHITRPDGLIAIALNHVDDYTIDITWHRTLDQQLGLILTTLSLIALAFTYRRKSQITSS